MPHTHYSLSFRYSVEEGKQKSEGNSQKTIQHQAIQNCMGCSKELWPWQNPWVRQVISNRGGTWFDLFLKNMLRAGIQPAVQMSTSHVRKPVFKCWFCFWILWIRSLGGTGNDSSGQITELRDQNWMDNVKINDSVQLYAEWIRGRKKRWKLLE